MTYAGQERQWREEELDWLHQQHEELAAQTALLRRIVSHTSLLYGVGVMWLILGVVGVLFIGLR